MIVSGFSADIYCDKCGDSTDTAEPTLGKCKKAFRKWGWYTGRRIQLCPDCAKDKKGAVEFIEAYGKANER